jgi:membrane-bound ClpP family serine protease
MDIGIHIGIIAGLLIIGVILFLVEIFLVPGISIAGVGGIIATIAAIVYAYMKIGLWAGHFTLVAAILLIVLALFITLRTNVVDKISLKTEIDSKVNTIQELNVSPGDQGMTISRLAPMGKVEVNGNILEAKSEDGLIEEQQLIEVVKVLPNNIIVKLKND